MGVGDTLPQNLQQALSSGILKRLPLTFLPFINQQLNQWENLFPRERQSVERLLDYVVTLSPEQSGAFFRDLVDLEDKMGVRNWQFSTSEQTILNSSQLARSPYFQQWRKAIQAVFDAAEQFALKTPDPKAIPLKKLVLLDMPERLPLDAENAWHRWQGIGRPIKLNLSGAGPSKDALNYLMMGHSANSEKKESGLLEIVRNRPGASAADTWVIDAGRDVVDGILGSETTPSTATNAILLSYQRLDLFRQNFSHEMNTMRKDLADADAVFDRLRKVDVAQWSPAEVAADPAIREFVRSLYLTGNGAVIYGNSFVQWASSEALRRARPSFLAAQFGVRSKPKPFTGVAVFDNPDQVNPLPAVDDLPGSAVDAQMLALYVWLAASRYDDYQSSTLCVCIAESISQAYIIAPPGSGVLQEQEPVPLTRLLGVLQAWVT